MAPLNSQPVWSEDDEDDVSTGSSADGQLDDATSQSREATRNAIQASEKPRHRHPVSCYSRSHSSLRGLPIATTIQGRPLPSDPSVLEIINQALAILDDEDFELEASFDE